MARAAHAKNCDCVGVSSILDFPSMTIADQLLASFSRIAASDGGMLALVEENAGTIRLTYRPGKEADGACVDGVCALPHVELEEMMRAWLARKAPDVQLEIKLLPV